ncbi:hypothetical protein D7S86_28785 [Pararobbsia silviterrae]|uniref:Aminoglycoside phosphotransferase domain-containing protein n=2 Tax=Pararobbsia silviterrae TaxID=1792498 RepID=A0A494WYE7_9BURK|nr:hypothetical protein D7S86_28785 [Pararobbsia silviterrae]
MAAIEIVHRCLGERPIAARRFDNGIQHYVYEVSFTHRASLVIRMTVPEQRQAMVGAKFLSAKLRPLGVPLPEIVSSGVEDRFPWLLLERLSGTDIGDVLGDLSNDAIDRVAMGVANAQRCVSSIEGEGRFGYAIHPRMRRIAVGTK